MTDDVFDGLGGKALMEKYQLVPIGRIISPISFTFSAEISLKEAVDWEKSIYVFLFNNEIVRVGSSKGKLGTRMQQWSKDVSYALQKLEGLSSKFTNTPESEAIKWANLLELYNSGEIYARQATIVKTPVGSFNAYMDEESILINRHKPALNRHKNR